MSTTTYETDQGQQPLHVDRRVLAAYLALALVIVLGYIGGGWAASLAQVGTLYFPFVLLAALAYLGIHSTPARIFTLLWMAILLFGATLYALSMGLIVTTDLSALQGGTVAMDPAIATTVGRIGGIAVVSILLSLLGFLPTVRSALSRLLPLNPTSFVHAVALVTVVAILLISFAPLLVVGVPPLLTESTLDMLAEQDPTGANTLLMQVFTLVWSIPIAILAVGYGIQRSFSGALRRLGLVRPTGRQVLIGLGVAVALVVAVHALGIVLEWVWRTTGWPATDPEMVNKLLAFALNPWAAILLSISAGLGEELAVRGVLQPRLGILISNLFFTSLHAAQYNWDALLVVFLAGVVLGILRWRTNTSTSAIAHAGYNFIQIMFTIYGITLFS